MDSLTLENDTRKNQEDHIGNKCTLVGFNVLFSVLLDTKKSTTTTAPPSVEVRSSVQYSVCLRQWVVFIGWTFSDVTIVRMVTSVRINTDCELFTCVLRTTFLPIIKE